MKKNKICAERFHWNETALFFLLFPVGCVLSLQGSWSAKAATALIKDCIPAESAVSSEEINS